jgi:putative endonuclease
MNEYRYVYVLRSLRDNLFYVGFTKNLKARLEIHNRGLVPSTRRRTPFELVYWEGCINQTDATQRENSAREVFENSLGKTIHKEQTKKLSHGVNGTGTTRP